MATLAELFQSLGSSVNTMTDDLRNAELENKMAEDDLGVSGTDVSQIPMGVLNALSGNRGQLALDYANQAIPMPEEANKYEAALRFFLEMGKQASQPGSTVLGSAFGAGQAPLDYLTAKNAEIRKAKQARASLGLQIAPSLKPKAVAAKTTYRPATADELKQYGAAAGQMGSDGKFYDLSKTAGTGKESLTARNYTVTADGGITIGTNLIPQGDVVQLTDTQRSIFGPTDLGPYEKAGSGDGTKTPKAYAVTEQNLTDLNTKLGRTLQRNSDGNVLLLPDQFLLVQDLVGPEAPATKTGEAKTELAKLHDDLDLALAGSQEAVAIQAQIDDLIRTTGFNKEIFQAEREIRKEWNAKKTPFNKIESSHKKLVASLERQSGVGDMSAIFVYMKMLDPGSVVRESEFAQAQQTAGAVESLIARMNQIAEGEKLSPAQRTEFLALAEDFYGLAKTDLTSGRYELGTILQGNLALNPSNIFGKELAPADFYVDRERFNLAMQAGFTMNEVWNSMSDSEKQAYGGQ
jgi:hypothetical protein